MNRFCCYSFGLISSILDIVAIRSEYGASVIQRMLLRYVSKDKDQMWYVWY